MTISFIKIYNYIIEIKEFLKRYTITKYKLYFVISNNNCRFFLKYRRIVFFS